jgi:peroxiredoxin
MLSKGSIAPDFALEDQGRRVVRLSDYRGRQNVVIAFHPFAFTPVCTRQMQAYQQSHDQLAGLDAEVVGISTDLGPAKAAWAASMGGLSFPVLADFNPHGAVAQAYGALRPDGLAERAIFVVDKSGRIAWSKLHGMDDDPSLDELLGVLAELGSRRTGEPGKR